MFYSTPCSPAEEQEDRDLALARSLQKEEEEEEEDEEIKSKKKRKKTREESKPINLLDDDEEEERAIPTTPSRIKNKVTRPRAVGSSPFRSILSHAESDPSSPRKQPIRAIKGKKKSRRSLAYDDEDEDGDGDGDGDGGDEDYVDEGEVSDEPILIDEEERDVLKKRKTNRKESKTTKVTTKTKDKKTGVTRTKTIEKKKGTKKVKVGEGEGEGEGEEKKEMLVAKKKNWYAMRADRAARGPPPMAGMKELPEGAPNCLAGMTFVSIVCVWWWCGGDCVVVWWCGLGDVVVWWWWCGCVVVVWWCGGVVWVGW